MAPKRIRERTRHQHGHLLRVVGLGLVLSACGGGVGTPAPAGPAGATEEVCPDVDAGQTRLTEYVRASDDLAALQPTLEAVLVDERGLIPLVSLALDVLGRVGPSGLFGLQAEYAATGGLGTLTPHLQEVLKYMRGTSAHLPGPHPGVIEVLEAILKSEASAQCDIGVVLDAVDAMAAFDIDGTPWFEAMSTRVKALADDAAFVELLAGISFDDDEGDIVLGQDAFILITRLIFANIAAPDFDPDTVRGLIDDVLVAQFVDDEAVAQRLRDLFDVVLAPFAATSPARVPFTGVIACWDNADESGALPEMLFDYFRTEELALDVFLDDLDAFAAGQSGDIAQPLSTDLVDALRANPQRTRDAARVLSAFFAEGTRDLTLDVLIGLKGRGVVSGVLGLWSALAEGCSTP